MTYLQDRHLFGLAPGPRARHHLHSHSHRRIAVLKDGNSREPQGHMLGLRLGRLHACFICGPFFTQLLLRTAGFVISSRSGDDSISMPRCSS